MLLTIVVVLFAGLVLAACTFSVVAVAVAGAPADAPTVEELVRRCAGLRGWEQVARAQREVHAAMPAYGFDNGFDTPRQALARGRGYCWHRAAILLAALRQLGIPARMVHAFFNRFDGPISGHVWLMVTVDGEERAVCPGDAVNTPGRVRFTPLSKVRAWGPGILALSYVGAPIANLFAFVVRFVRQGANGRGLDAPNFAREAGAGEPRASAARILRSGFWPLAPLLAWNAAVAPRLPALFADDAAVPAAILVIEALGRGFVVIAPIFLTVGREHRWQRRGLALFIGGALAYLASWSLLLVESAPSWSWLGPHVLPVVWLAGLGLMARSGAYLVGALVFVLAHVSHGVVLLLARV